MGGLIIPDRKVSDGLIGSVVLYKTKRVQTYKNEKEGKDDWVKFPKYDLCD